MMYIVRGSDAVDSHKQNRSYFRHSSCLVIALPVDSLKDVRALKLHHYFVSQVVFSLLFL